MIEFENIDVTYPGGLKALNNVSLTIPDGELLVIVGLSGAGKSTPASGRQRVCAHNGRDR